MNEHSENKPIFGGGSGAFFFKTDIFGNIDGQPIVAADRIILYDEYQTMSDEEAQKAFAEASTYTVTIGPTKMTKAMKKFLHEKKARLPRKLKKKNLKTKTALSILSIPDDANCKEISNRELRMLKWCISHNQ